MKVTLLVCLVLSLVCQTLAQSPCPSGTSCTYSNPGGADCSQGTTCNFECTNGGGCGGTMKCGSGLCTVDCIAGNVACQGAIIYGSTGNVVLNSGFDGLYAGYFSAGTGNSTLYCTNTYSCMYVYFGLGSGYTYLECSAGNACNQATITGGGGPIDLVCANGGCDGIFAFAPDSSPFRAPGYGPYTCTNNMWQCADGSCQASYSSCLSPTPPPHTVSTLNPCPLSHDCTYLNSGADCSRGFECNFRCVYPNFPCQGATLNCGTGPCTLQCTAGNAGCAESTINANPSSSATITIFNGFQGIAEANFYGGAGKAYIYCTEGGACFNSWLHLGTGYTFIHCSVGYTSEPGCQNLYIYSGGGLIDLICDSGACPSASFDFGSSPFRAIGVPSYTCTNNMWQCPDGRCVIHSTTCALPANQCNATTAGTIFPQTPADQNAVGSCQAGYGSTGTPTRYCSPTGVWSTYSNLCVRLYCPATYDATLDYTWPRYPALATALAPRPTRVCDSTGNWEAPTY